ncbi:MAG: phosphoribosylformylglycinamidine synthase subunit PurL [Candidatus Methanoperedens sp.]|nr:phosphoribosylformylglycinamidine synthase subunit PurL [Candidatus Methanoperedens sp.]MCZ7369850.1 phosphoribosylformylglycinamidine synthase subunit PurL [Candidatus Methanoperedens sp.]
MASRIEVAFKKGVRDALGESIKKRIIDDIHINVESVRTIDVYTFDPELTKEELSLLGDKLFADPVIQVFSEKPLARDFSWLIEVGFRPGVTDNVGTTAKKASEDVLRTTLHGVYFSKQYLLKGDLSKENAERIAGGLLANGLIEKWEIVGNREWDKKKGVRLPLPVVKEKHIPSVSTINLHVSENELKEISRQRLLALNISEMRTIQKYFNNKEIITEREEIGLSMPTDVEIEVLAQTWSEHCKHKIFNSQITYTDGKITKTINSLFDTFIKRSTREINKPWLVSVFTDNAGVIKFNDEHNLVMKVETHNTPSALDPYGGAITGIVGVNRDPLGTGMGARLIFNTDVLCFASPFYDMELPPRLFHPKRIFEGVRRGVEHGGNKSGIPTVNGCIVFDDRYLGKPLVYCGTGGIMPSAINGKPSHIKEIQKGDLIVMTGGRIGKDGIHGATFSSLELDENSPVTAVQIGDPITQKKMLDFLLEARDKGLYDAITDNGAGGLSSSVGEMAQLSGGCLIELEKCPLKYAGLDPWEILLSESQERMTLAVAPDKIDEFLQFARTRDVEATVIGTFTASGKFHAKYGDNTVAYLGMDFLHKGLPIMKLNARWVPGKFEEPVLGIVDLAAALKNLLSRLNICSKEYVIRQYDHEVQGGSVIKPLQGDGPSDAAVVRPLLDSMEGVVVANGICPRYGDIDTYHMTACAIDEAIRNHIAVGGSLDHVAGLDNFCWCDPVKSVKNPDGEFKLAQLVRANMALYDYTKAYGVPCISGKDSMKNDYIIGNRKISIPPTVLFSTIGKIEDVRKAVTMDVKRPDDRVYVLGMTKDELGASEYYASLGFIGNDVPKVDATLAKRLYAALEKAISEGLVASCHDCSDGGLGVALAESAFSGGLGVTIELTKVPVENIKRADTILFSESQSRFVVTLAQDKVARFEEIMKRNVLADVGVVTAQQNFTVMDGEKVVLSAGIDELKEAWQKTLRW